MEQEKIPIELLYKKLEDTLSESEKGEVEQWLKRRTHREYFRWLEYISSLPEPEEVTEQELQDAWQVMYKRICSHSMRIAWTIGKTTAIAASLVIGVCIWYLFFKSADQTVPKEKIVCIEPGKQSATLELADGKIHRLGNNEVKGRQISSHILVEHGQVSYARPDSRKSEIVYNKLSVPRGGEYQLKLEDGTKVWLNSDSHLKYPEAFVGKQREVFLEGEAYFEVAQNIQKPFIVRAGNQMIKVLGTGFGITYYTDEEVQTVTLVHGKVEVGFGKAEQSNFMLSPGQQISYNRRNHQVKCEDVDVWEHIAWKDGKYVFNKKRLEDMLNTLSRWYDFQIFYRDDRCKDILFSGEIRRFENFNSILELIQKTSDVRFVVAGDMVSVINN